MVRRSLIGAAALLVAGCASRQAAVPIAVVAPPPPVLMVAPLPPGATPGMLVPVALPDGSYPTPNQRVSAVAAVWHLRAGLNVAALACPAGQGAAITAGYNAMIAVHKAELKTAEAGYAAEYRLAGGVDWRDRYDDAMTRLYNFFSQTPVRADFCAAAEKVTAQVATVAPGGLGSFAAGELPTLDRPFTEFYRAYDAWRSGSTARPVIAVAATTPAVVPAPVIAMVSAPRAPVAVKDVARPSLVLGAVPQARVAEPARVPPATPQPVPASPPRLELDLSTLPVDAPVGG